VGGDRLFYLSRVLDKKFMPVALDKLDVPEHNGTYAYIPFISISFCSTCSHRLPELDARIEDDSCI